MIDDVVRFIAQVLAYSLLGGALVLAGALLALAAVRRGRARTRYAILSIALGLHLSVPFVAAGGLAMRRLAETSSVVASGEPLAPELRRVTEVASAAFAPVVRVVGAPRAAPSPVTLDRVRAIVVALWVLGVVVGATWFAMGWVAIRRIVRTGRAADATVRDRLRALCDRMRVARSVRVVASTAVDVPFTSGALRPVIVIPDAMFAMLDVTYADAIIAHELAHVRRMDYLFGVVQSVAMTVLFHHPATWWLDRQLRLEREYCADDVAVGLAGDRAVYARALGEFESRRMGLSSLAMAAGDGSLVARIERLAGVDRVRRSVGLGVACVLVALVIGTATAQITNPPARQAAQRPAATYPTGIITVPDSVMTRVRDEMRAYRVAGHFDADTALFAALMRTLSVSSVGAGFHGRTARVKLENWRKTDLSDAALVPIARLALSTVLRKDPRSRMADTLRVTFSDYNPDVATLTWITKDFHERPERVQITRTYAQRISTPPPKRVP